VLVRLDVGFHRMDGATALWYARSRATTSDFDRNRRHQMLLRAMWERFMSENLWDTIPDLWEDFQNVVDTDLSLAQILSLVPIGLDLEPRLIESHFIGPDQVQNFTTYQGARVLTMRPEAIRRVVTQFYTPPTLNQLYRESPRIEIVNASGVDGLDQVAIERLNWEGFAPSPGTETFQKPYARTVIYDYTGNSKGSSVDTLVRVLGVQDMDVIVEPDPNRSLDYRVILGESYANDACTFSPWRGSPQVD
jgi:hypothetical protein